MDVASNQGQPSGGTGGAPAPSASVSPQASVQQRLKAFLYPPSAQQDGAAKESAADEPSQSPESTEEPADPRAVDTKAPVQRKAEPDAQAEAEEAPADEPTDDAQTDEVQLSSLKDLTEATGLDAERIMDLEVPTKIDGKEGTARLRDLVRSYQLDGHLNQKQATLDNDRKAFLAEREKSTRETADRILKLDAGVQTLERALAGEFAAVDWQKLQAEDPVSFNAQWVAYQQKVAVLQDIARQIAAERQQAQAQQAEQYKTWAEEQKRLFEAKLPEWMDKSTRNRDRASILEYLQTYGFSKEEFEGLMDHRYALVIRDAWKYAALQKSKPATLNKVRAAPRLLKPGTQQSRAAQDRAALSNDRARLKQTGRARDAGPVLKRLLFNQ